MENLISFKGLWKINIDGCTVAYSNQILDAGLEALVANLDSYPFWKEGISDGHVDSVLFNRIVVGSGDVQVTYTDTSLSSPLFEEYIKPSMSSSPTPTGNGARVVLAARFDKASAYTIKEIGLTGPALFSRVVIPPINVKPNEKVEISYDLTVSASSGAGTISYYDSNQVQQSSSMIWYFPQQSLVNGLSQKFFSPTALFCSTGSVTNASVSNLETSIASLPSVQVNGKSFRIHVHVPGQDIGTLQVGSIADMLSTFFVFNPTIVGAGLNYFDLEFDYLLGGN